MILAPAAPPVPVQGVGGFDYVTVDSVHRRVYAAHTGNDSLLIVDADSGKVLRQVHLGETHGVAFDPSSSTVFTGNGTAHSLSKIDATTGKILGTATVPGNVDAIAYDEATQRIYGDEDDGTRIFVIDAKTMKQIATIALPGHKPEYLALDGANTLYQNIDNLGEVAVVDLQTNKVSRIMPTKAIVKNHPLQLDRAWGHLWVGGKNGTLAQYDLSGKLLHKVAIQAAVDQCTLDAQRHRIACAGSGKVTVVQDSQTGAPTVVGSMSVNDDTHTVGIDEKSGDFWIVWSDQKHDYVQRLQLK